MRRQTTVLSTLVLGTTLVLAGCNRNEPPAETAAPAEDRAAHMPAPHLAHALWVDLGYAKQHGDLLDAPWPQEIGRAHV